MLPEHGKKLAEAFAHVMETVAFTFVEPMPRSDVPAVVEAPVCVRMGFRGPLSGTLCLAGPDAFTQPMATSILGADPEVPLAHSRRLDALKEILNVTCGQFLTLIAGREPVFDLTIPEQQPADAECWQRVLRSEDTVAFLVDEQWPVVLRLQLDANS